MDCKEVKKHTHLYCITFSLFFREEFISDDNLELMLSSTLKEVREMVSIIKNGGFVIQFVTILKNLHQSIEELYNLNK